MILRLGDLIIIMALVLSGETKTNCLKMFHDYGNLLKNFLNCSMDYAVPVKFCINCSFLYYELQAKYDSLMKAEVMEENHLVRCRDHLIDQDRLNIILGNHDYFTNLWDHAACSQCFSINNTSPNNETLSMLDKLTKLENCLHDKMNSDPCNKCAVTYNQANSYYNDEFVKKYNERICFDIRDLMNRTRSTWSKILKCCKREGDFESFIAVSSTILSLPFIFYVIMYFYTKRIEHFGTTLSNNELNSTNDSNSSSQYHNSSEDGYEANDELNKVEGAVIGNNCSSSSPSTTKRKSLNATNVMPKTILDYNNYSDTDDDAPIINKVPLSKDYNKKNKNLL